MSYRLYQKPFHSFLHSWVSFSVALGMLVASGCASRDKKRLDEARSAYVRGDLSSAEKALRTPEVDEAEDNRVLHLFRLGSVAFSQQHFEKAIFFYSRARDVSAEYRAKKESFWGSSAYGGTPTEMIVANLHLALSFWELSHARSVPETQIEPILNSKNSFQGEGRVFPARTLSDQDRSMFLSQARAEVLALDSLITRLDRAEVWGKNQQGYALARAFAAKFHESLGNPRERRTAELLVRQTQSEADRSLFLKNALDSSQRDLWANKKDLASAVPASWIELGVIPELSEKQITIGLSTIFGLIEDPATRRLVEEVGLRTLLALAPEFGLTTLFGAISGVVADAATGEDLPQFYSEAVDSGIGFQMSYPELSSGDSILNLKWQSVGESGQEDETPRVWPLRKILAQEIKHESHKNLKSRAIKQGVAYIAALVPAVKAYIQAKRNQNYLMMIGVIAGFAFTKKVIEKANSPDLRSWGFLPEWVIIGNKKISSQSVLVGTLSGPQGDRMFQISVGERSQLPLFRLHQPVIPYGDLQLKATNKPLP